MPQWQWQGQWRETGANRGGGSRGAALLNRSALAIVGADCYKFNKSGAI
jgi:hypothetical protein